MWMMSKASFVLFPDVNTNIKVSKLHFEISGNTLNFVGYGTFLLSNQFADKMALP